MYKYLFRSIKINQMKLKNRIIMPAMGTKLCSESGGVTQSYIDFYIERAKGDVGLIITEDSCIESPRGKGSANPLCISDDSFIPGLEEFVGEMHRYGAKVAIQLYHAGSKTNLEFTKGIIPITSYVDNHKVSSSLIKEMDIDEINDIIKKFGDAALRAKRIGFDAIELHGAHGYLISQFLSPYFNKRFDEYGGDLTGRLNFAIQIIREVRKRVGKEFPLIFRLSAHEYVCGGNTLKETKIIAQKLENAGVDAIHVSGGLLQRSKFWVIPPMYISQDCRSLLSYEIKKIVKVPVIVAGRINNPLVAEEIIRGKKADIVALGRALIADPYFVKKISLNRENEIIPCIACNIGCIGRATKQLRIRCTLNPTSGRENRFNIKKTFNKKKIVVVGGGPGGMQAAYISYLKGHKVFLYEKENSLGGMLRYGSIPSFKSDIRALLDFYKIRLSKTDINLNFGIYFDRNVLMKVNPDILIIAVGALDEVPNIKGINENNFFTAAYALENPHQLGDKVVILGGGEVGCETALYLTNKGKEVIIFEIQDDILKNAESGTREYLYILLRQSKIKILVDVKIKEISKRKINFLINKKNNIVNELHYFDNLIVATGYKPNVFWKKEFIKICRKSSIELFPVGSCLKPNNLFHIITEASDVAFNL